MNNLNPLFEAMNDIDDNIASEAIKEKRRHTKGLKAILIAAAAAVFCATTTITAVAVLKAPREIMINNVPIEPHYTVYTDELGNEISLYVIDIPDDLLGEEIEGYTAVGEIKVVPDPDKQGEYMIVDEAGNSFTHINNKIVQYHIKGTDEMISSPPFNLREGYKCLSSLWIDREGTEVFRKAEYYILPYDQIDELVQEISHGYFTTSN